MLLDDLQKNAIRVAESTLLQAGPGSGKTRTLVAKALRESVRLRNTPFRVACITMSRVASDVIKERVRTFATADDEERITVGTIHSFALQEIFEPFHKRVLPYEAGWDLIAPEEERYVSYVERVFQAKSEHAYRQLPTIRRGIDGTPENLGSCEAADVALFWETLEADGIIDFPSLLFRSVAILDDDDIAEYLSARYSWILIDEFQDTTDMQLAILSKLGRASTHFFLVGDVNQAIYAFAGASREAQEAFVKSLGISKPIKLARNYRSNQEICNVANALIPAGITSCSDPLHAEMPIIRHSNQNNYAELARRLKNNFLTVLENRGISRADGAIIAPNSFIANDLRSALQNIGINSRSTLDALERPPLTRLIRGLAEYTTFPSIIALQFVFTALNQLLELGTSTQWHNDEATVRVCAFDVIERFVELRSSGPCTFAQCFRAIADFVTSRSRELLLVPRLWEEAAFEAERFLSDNKGAVEAFDPLTFRLNLGDLLVSYIFRCKGLEFEAAAIVELNAGVLPHWRSNDHDIDRRTLFVGVTRPCQFLELYADRGNASEFVRELLDAGVIARINRM